MTQEVLSRQQIYEKFLNTAQRAYARYTGALEHDRRGVDSETRFVWGEVNPGLSKQNIFLQVMGHLLTAVSLEQQRKCMPLDKNEEIRLQETNLILHDKFGPEGTNSASVLSEMRDQVGELVSIGVTYKWANQVLNILKQDWC